MGIIDKKTVEHLAELSRIEIADEEKEKLAGDLEKILKYFEELKEVDTDGVKPMNGGTTETNVMRDDINENGAMSNERKDIIKKAFPEEKDGFLKVPAVFE